MVMTKRKYIVSENQLSNLIFLDYVKDLFGFDKDDVKKDPELVKAIDKLNPVTTQSTPYVPTNVSDSDFEVAVEEIIDGLEGGYYHPDMKKKDPVRFQGMLNSGETMYGMDRKWGMQEKTAPGREFWRLIDNENARTNWKHDYRLEDNPELAKTLKRLIAEIMKPLFDKYSRLYLEPESRKIVMSDKRLYTHFVYAVWNGSGRFQQFADKFDKHVIEDGITDPDTLAKLVVQDRINSGNKILKSTAGKVNKVMNNVNNIA